MLCYEMHPISRLSRSASRRRLKLEVNMMARHRRRLTAERSPELDAVIGDLAQVQADLRALSQFLTALVDIDQSGQASTVDDQKKKIEEVINRNSVFVGSVLDRIGSRMGGVYERPGRPEGKGYELAPYRFELEETHNL